MGRDEGRDNEDFSELVHRILISGGNGRIKHVAAQLDMGYDNFYARLCGRVAFNADDIRCLFAVTRDVRIIEFFIADTGFLITVRADGDPVVEHADPQRLAYLAHQVVYDSVDLLRAIAHGLSDGKFDHRDRALARQKVNDSERALATLRTLLVDDTL